MTSDKFRVLISLQLDAAEKRCEKQIAESERLRATLSGQSVTLRKSKQRQHDLEELVLQLRDELDVARSAVSACQQDAADIRTAKADVERETRRAEAKIKAAAREIAEVRNECSANVARAHENACLTVERLQLQVRMLTIFSGMTDRKSTRLNSSHLDLSRMPSSA